MNDEQLLRYSRHILLPQIGIEGQQAIVDARALVVGAGGLGSPAAYYLASAGIGTLALADGDHGKVDELEGVDVRDYMVVVRGKKKGSRRR